MTRIKKQFNLLSKFYNQTVMGKQRHLVIAFFAGLMSIFLNLLLAYVLRGIYVAIAVESDAFLIRTVLIFLLIVAGAFLYNFIFWLLFGSSSAKITGGIRRQLFEKLCSLRLIDVEGGHSGEMLSIFTSDLDMSQGAYVNVRLYAASLLLGIIPTFLIFRISPFLGLFIFSLGILQLFINLGAVRPLERQSVLIREETAQLNRTYADALHGNLSIRLYGSEDFYGEVSNAINRRLYREKLKLNLINTAISAVNISFGLFGYIVLLLFGKELIWSGNLTLPDLLFIAQMRLAMIQGILTLGDYTVQMQPAFVAVQKIVSFLENSVEENEKSEL